ncbi:hypothetical protein ACTMS0_18450 [Micromonospora sp. H33]|uniref:hypothetical protein n=1 Tax=Micromonospora sp. H33 TaxID=3452215 RepID=UPI003F88C8D0
MTGRQGGCGPAEVKTSGRMATLATAKSSVKDHKLRGEQQTEPGLRYGVDVVDATALVEQWPAAPKKVAQQMITQYGPPNEATQRVRRGSAC